MERLTYDFCLGDIHCWHVKGADNRECRQVCEEQEENGCKGCPIALAFDRLAAYEDTGFTPEEVQAMRWIPVEERLPKPEFKDQQRGFYLVTLSNGVVKELIYEFRHYDNMMFDVGWHDTAFPVTHWMPLPKAPKEEKKMANYDIKKVQEMGLWDAGYRKEET